MKNCAILFLFLIAAYLPSYSRDVLHADNAVLFKENKGQITDQYHNGRDDIKFYGTADKLCFFLSNNKISYQFYELDNRSATTNICRADISWIGVNKNVKILTGPAMDYKEYYYLNGKRLDNINCYEQLVYENIYQGIDLKYFSSDGQLKYDYIIAPHADYKQIQMKVEGGEVSIKDGSIVIHTRYGDIMESAPLVYQEGKKLNASWALSGNVLSFEIEGYDANKEMVIDPLVLVPGVTYNVSSSFATDCAIDTGNNIVFTGYQAQTGAGTERGFLKKWDGTTTVFQNVYPDYSSLSANAISSANGCVTDQNGNIYLTGRTTATNGIAISGAYQVSYGGGNSDGFIVKIGSAGNALWATYLGGSGDDVLNKCALDANSNLYVVGKTGSNSIATTSAYQSSYGGGTSDGLIAKFTSSGTMVWVSYYGGSGRDEIRSITSDGYDHLFFCGLTTSNSSIATAGSFQSNFMGSNTNGFLIKMDTSGTRSWGSYYGNDSTTAEGCILDSLGHFYVCGVTNATTDIATSGVFQSSAPGTIDGYLAKFDTSGNRIWATYIGGSNKDYISGCVANGQSVYVCGSTYSSNNISTPGAIEMNYSSGGSNALVQEFDTSGQRLWGSYIYSTSVWIPFPSTAATNCRLDDSGYLYVCGWYRTSPFSTVPNAIVYKFKHITYTQPIISVSPSDSFCTGITATLSTDQISGAIYQWYRNGVLLSGNTNTYTTTLPGDYFVAVTIGTYTDSSQIMTLYTLPVPSISPVQTDVMCYGDNSGSIVLNASGSGAPFTYTWANLPDTTDSLVNLSAGIYVATVTSNDGCQYSDTFMISEPLPLSVNSYAIPVTCTGSPIGEIHTNVGGGNPPYSYGWYNLSDTTSFLVNLTAGDYILTVTDQNNCTATDTITVEQDFSPQPSTPLAGICAVTVDSISQKNLVIWEKTGAVRASQYNIYRETSVSGQYQFIAAVPRNQLSVYLDMSSQPSIQNYRYKISETDSCNNEFSLSDYHQTIHLQSSTGSNGEINLMWNQYIGVVYSTCYIMRSTNGGSFINIAQVSASTSSYTDVNPPSGLNIYHIDIDAASGCNPTAKTASYQYISSNNTVSGVNSVPAVAFSNTILSPNPTSDVVNIVGKTPSKLVVIDAQGRVLSEQHNVSSISMKQFAAGRYIIKLYDEHSLIYYYGTIIKQ